MERQYTSLFRPEAVQARHGALPGKVLVPSPKLTRWGAMVSTACASAVFAALAFGDYAPRELVVGTVVPQQGLVKIFPPREGRVAFVPVKEGDPVKRGQVLLYVSAEEGYTDADGKGLPQRILSLLELEQQRIRGALKENEKTRSRKEKQLKAAADRLRLDLGVQRAQRDAVEAQKQAAEAMLAKMEALRAKGFITELDVISRKQQVLELERQLHASSAAIIASEGRLDDAEREIGQAPIEQMQTESTLRNQLSEVERQLLSYEANRGYTITAPISGRVTAFMGDVGKTLDTALPVMAILSEDAVFEAELLVPSRAIGFVAEGQDVRIRYAAFPHEQYGAYTGVVKRISRATVRVGDITNVPQLTDSVYLVRATLENQSVTAQGQPHPLKAGMELEADILLSRRPLWNWFLGPLLAFRDRA
jgi:membrane fusion protein